MPARIVFVRHAQLGAVQKVTPAAEALGLPVRTWPELREWESGLLPSKALARMAVGSHGMFVSRALMVTGHHADMEFIRVMPMPAIYEVTSWRAADA
ncbi:hypothetical protein [Lentzea sp. NPDC051838]|uniref:hypothetical protein n=1 Tax=Lentzea sp. NPDC051838 TaxID=3154849 RepID=UPI003424F39D